MKKNIGIALVQVLIIAMVLSLFGLILMESLKKQVDTALDIQQSFKKRALIENAKAKLIFALLTEHKDGGVYTDNAIAKKWNFYGQPFDIGDNIKVSLQDLRSLISLNHTNNVLTASVLSRLGMERGESEVFLDSLADWKDKDDLQLLNGAESAYYKSKQVRGPRNGYLQSIAEVTNIRGANKVSLENWYKYFTIQFMPYFNPLNAPVLILQAFVQDGSAVKEIIKLREENKLNYFSFFQLTGVDTGEFINFATGDAIRVKMELKEKGFKISHQFTIVAEPTSLNRPVVLTNVTWNRQ